MWTYFISTIQSFGSQGSGHGQFSAPCGVAVDDDGNILVVDAHSNCIHKFTSDGKFITAVGKRGSLFLEFNSTRGIATQEIIYVVDKGNHRIQILNPDLTFSSSFGSYGSGNGQFISPIDVACDTTGNVCVVE